MEYRNDWSEFKPLRFEYLGKWVHNWFSNMSPASFMLSCEAIYDLWPSVENYYQAMKTEHMPTQEAIRQANPFKAKQMGKRVHLRAGWPEIKEDVMMRALRAKFAQEPWNKLLMDTQDTQIIEWNNWGDSYWGADIITGKGLNRLGCLLMTLRKEFKEAKNIVHAPD